MVDNFIMNKSKRAVEPQLKDTGPLSKIFFQNQKGKNKKAPSYARNLIEASLDPMLTISPRGKITDVNEATVSTMGIARNALIGSDFSSCFTDPKKACAGYLQIFEKGFLTDYPLTIRRNTDGELMDVFYNASLYRDAYGNVLGAVATARNTTNLKRAVREFIESSGFPEGVLQNSMRYSVYTEDLNHTIISWNEGARCAFGYLPEEIIGQNSYSLHIPEDIESGAVDELTATALEKGSAEGVFRRVRKDGSVFMENLVVIRRDDASKRPKGYLVGSFDVSNIQPAGNHLQVGSQYHRDLIEASLDPFVIINAEGKITDANKAAELVTGLARSCLIGTDFSDYFLESKKAAEGYQTALNKGLVKNFPLTLRHRSGTTVNVMYNASVAYNEEGKMIGVFAAARDVTALKQAEESLASEKDLLSVTLHCIGDGVITTDTHGNVFIMNKIAEELTGWNQAEALGRPIASIFNIIHENSRTALENPVDRVLASGKAVEQSDNTILISRDGAEHLIADSATPIMGKNNAFMGAVIVFRDITIKQKLLDTTQNIQKLESLGILAGGIAHDFNNLLGAIFGFIDLAMCAPDEEKNAYLSKAMSTIDRARALTGQLLTFAKGGDPIRQVDKLFPFVQETVQFALSGSNVSYTFKVSLDLWACNYDKNQIGQAIDNIVINALQAMPMGGIIELTARNITMTEGGHPRLKEGNYVKISIRDYGIGIPKNIIGRIFDPFFTTKAKGHGLGLATCYSIIKRHDGFVDIESELGKGTTVHLYLPAVSDSVPETLKVTNIEFKGSGNIIFMDDEEMLRDAVEQMLRSLGYNPICKSNGKEALECFIEERQKGNDFTGIIVDFTVPGGLGGNDIIKDIRELDPRIPVFVASGYAQDPIIMNPVKYGFTASLPKPFTRAALSKLLRKHLFIRSLK